MKARGMLLMDYRQCRWLGLIMLAYFGYLMVAALPYRTFPMLGEDGVEVSTQALIFVQLIPCAFCCLLATVQFEETFRTPPREYLQTLYIPKSVLLVLRPLVTLLPIVLLYLPVSIRAANAMTLSAAENCQYLPKGAQSPVIEWDFLYLQSVPMLICCYSATILLECVTRSKAVTLILMLTWFGLEAGGFYRQFGAFSMFRNALRNFVPMSGAQVNTYSALICAVVFFTILLLIYRRKGTQ